MWVEDEKGYPVEGGYMGYINGSYEHFETEEAYKEALLDAIEQKEE